MPHADRSRPSLGRPARIPGPNAAHARSPILPVLCLAALLGGACARPTLADAPDDPGLVLRGVPVLDGTGGAPLIDQDVWIDRGRIAGIGSTGALPLPAGTGRAHAQLMFEEAVGAAVMDAILQFLRADAATATSDPCADALPLSGVHVEPNDTFGFAAITVEGHSYPEWVGDATFGLTPDGDAFYLALAQPEVGHFEATFRTPGQTSYPPPGDHPVVSAAGRAAPTGRAAHAVVGELSLFMAHDETYRDYVPRTGTLTVMESGPAGICGRLDVAWVPSNVADTSEVRTAGSFRAVQNRHSAEPGRSPPASRPATVR